MEELRKAHKRARMARAGLNVISAFLLGTGVAVTLGAESWPTGIAGMSLVFIGILGLIITIKLGEYVKWLSELIDRVESPFIRAYFSRYRDGEKTAVKFPFERFMNLYAIDQKNSWQIGDTRCCYDHTTKKKEKIAGTVVPTSKTLRVYVWFGFFDYLKFKRFLKNQEAIAEKKKQEKQRAHEVELCKEFIQALEKDVKAYVENGPFKEEESPHE